MRRKGRRDAETRSASRKRYPCEVSPGWAFTYSVGKGWTVWAPVGVRMPGCDLVQPDIVVVRREDRHIIHDRCINGVPALIVEVLSPSPPETGETIKRTAYARVGMPEYWIVRPASRDVVRCTSPDRVAGNFLQTTLIAVDGTLTSPTLPFNAPVAGFFAGSPDETV
jgi:Uma2 family endonuclease